LSDAPEWMSPPVQGSDRTKWAQAVVQSLAAEASELQALAEAAQRPYCQSTTNRNAAAVVQTPREAITALEQLHFLFRLRALAHLECRQPAEAAEDLLTSLRFARFAGQSPDVLASAREQVMATRSLQPLWEGMVRQQWTEPQLAAIQTELAGLNLLTDHTNAIRRVVCACIESWLPMRQNAARSSVPASTGGYFRQSGWEIQPGNWWYDRCIQLHEAGSRAIQRVDATAGRVRLEVNWDDLRGLPLDNEMQQLLQQYYWSGAHPGLVSFAQTAVNQGILACALERWRLTHGKYPESLESLGPDYLDRIPNDLVRGRPMIYQRLGDDRFILRGVGPNDVDDRKATASDDWLWAFPTNAAPKTATAPK
jgi:hypothetical protein